jgi:hypothetical protein
VLTAVVPAVVAVIAPMRVVRGAVGWPRPIQRICSEVGIIVVVTCRTVQVRRQAEGKGILVLHRAMAATVRKAVAARLVMWVGR